MPRWNSSLRPAGVRGRRWGVREERVRGGGLTVAARVRGVVQACSTL
jgi:hypothetical protein